MHNTSIIGCYSSNNSATWTAASWSRGIIPIIPINPCWKRMNKKERFSIDQYLAKRTNNKWVVFQGGGGSHGYGLICNFTNYYKIHNFVWDDAGGSSQRVFPSRRTKQVYAHIIPCSKRILNRYLLHTFCAWETSEKSSSRAHQSMIDASLKFRPGIVITSTCTGLALATPPRSLWGKVRPRCRPSVYPRHAPPLLGNVFYFGRIENRVTGLGILQLAHLASGYRIPDTHT